MIARLTVREAMRRKLVAVFLVITVAMVSLSAWGFYRLSHSRTITSGEVHVALPQALILFMFMFSFVVALSASAIASPAVSAEVESGVLQTIVTRPIRRSEVIVGKWLGLAVLVAGYSFVVAGLEMAVVDLVSGFLPPNPVAAALYLFAEGAVLLTLVLLISTRLSALATGVVGVALFGSAWLAGVVGRPRYRRFTYRPCAPSERSRAMPCRLTDFGTGSFIILSRPPSLPNVFRTWPAQVATPFSPMPLRRGHT